MTALETGLGSLQWAAKRADRMGCNITPDQAQAILAELERLRALVPVPAPPPTYRCAGCGLEYESPRGGYHLRHADGCEDPDNCATKRTCPITCGPIAGRAS